MTAKVYKICKFAFAALLIIILLLNLTTVYNTIVKKEQVSMVFGYGSAIILSGSMEPAISVDDVIIIAKQNSYNIGDIVTYKGNSRSVTHRIIDVVEAGFVTKGDANNAPDDPVSEDRIIGKVVARVPKAGKVLSFLQNPVGIIVMLGLLITLDRISVLIDKKLEP